MSPTNFFTRHVTRPSSLLNQLHAAEQDLLTQRAQLHTHVTALGRNMQQRMTSPGNLLWAAGLGFLASEFTRCKHTQLTESNDVATDSDQHSQPIGIMTTVLKYVTIARSLAATASTLWHEYGPQAHVTGAEEEMEVSEDAALSSRS